MSTAGVFSSCIIPRAARDGVPGGVVVTLPHCGGMPVAATGAVGADMTAWILADRTAERAWFWDFAKADSATGAVGAGARPGTGALAKIEAPKPEGPVGS